MKEKKVKEKLTSAYDDNSPVDGSRILRAAKNELCAEVKPERAKRAVTARITLTCCCAVLVCSVVIAVLLSMIAGTGGYDTTEGISMQDYFYKQNIELISFSSVIGGADSPSGGDDSVNPDVDDPLVQGFTLKGCTITRTKDGKTAAVSEAYVRAQEEIVVAAFFTDDQEVLEDVCPSLSGEKEELVEDGVAISYTFDETEKICVAELELKGVKFRFSFSGTEKETALGYLRVFVRIQY